MSIATRASILSEYADPFAAPELVLMRESLRSWRFYDTFRIDAGAVARRPSVGTFTPIIKGDGSKFVVFITDHNRHRPYEFAIVTMDRSTTRMETATYAMESA